MDFAHNMFFVRPSGIPLESYNHLPFTDRLLDGIESF